MKTVIFTRVSTGIQNTIRQVNELRDVAKQRQYTVLEIFEEQTSGAKTVDERPVLSNMIRFAKENEVKIIMISELSRLGRKVTDVLNTIELLSDEQISIYIKDINMLTLDERGKQLPLTSLMLGVMTSVAQLEREQIKERMKSGYKNFRKNGGKVGRKEGVRKSVSEVLAKHADVVKFLNKGFSIRNTMRLTGKSDTTVKKVRKLLKDDLSNIECLVKVDSNKLSV